MSRPSKLARLASKMLLWQLANLSFLSIVREERRRHLPPSKRRLIDAAIIEQRIRDIRIELKERGLGSPGGLREPSTNGEDTTGEEFPPLHDYD
jgi:hypothetical protein